MSDPTTLSLPGLGGAVLLTALAVLLLALAALLDRSGPIRVRHWAKSAGGRLQRLFSVPERFEAFRYVLSFLARAAPALLVGVLTWLLVDLAGGLGRAVLWALVAVAAVLLLAEWLSRRLALRAEQALNRLTLFYRASLTLLGPFVSLLRPLFAVSAARAEGEGNDEDEATNDEIEAFLDVGAKEGILEPGEGDLIMRVIDFGDEVVRGVMTPRTDMVCASVETPLEELASVFLDSNHSRIPLYGRSVDDIRGVLHIRDVLGALRTEPPPPAEALALPPLFVPETKPLAQMLRELQTAHQHLALVVDEYGGTAGLVTIEDLLEEIVGEIVDEHDEEAPETVRLPDGSYVLDGMTNLDVLERLFGLDLEDEPYETVGGLVFGRVGDLPEKGASLVIHGLRFTVQEVADRRVDRVRVVTEPPAPAPQ